jgi:DNA adenine methylase
VAQIASKTNKHFSPLRYPGGKSCLSDFLTCLIDINNLNHCTYAEPYAGGAGAALTLLMLEKVENILINDFDKAIYSFWKSVIYDSERFINKLKRVPLNLMEWENQKRIYLSKTSDSFKLGFATFYLNRTNRSGIIEGGPIGGTQQTGEWKIDARFNRQGLIGRVEKIARYRNRIEISNKDGIDLIKELRSRKDIFTYLDPPYFLKGSSLYLNYYNESDHEQLAKILNRNQKMNWILTYDNVPQISCLYSKRNIYEFSLNYHADTAKIGQELLIFSDKLIMPVDYL